VDDELDPKASDLPPLEGRPKKVQPTKLNDEVTPTADDVNPTANDINPTASDVNPTASDLPPLEDRPKKVKPTREPEVPEKKWDEIIVPPPPA